MRSPTVFGWWVTDAISGARYGPISGRTIRPRNSRPRIDVHDCQYSVGTYNAVSSLLRTVTLPFFLADEPERCCARRDRDHPCRREGDELSARLDLEVVGPEVVGGVVRDRPVRDGALDLVVADHLQEEEPARGDDCVVACRWSHDDVAICSCRRAECEGLGTARMFHAGFVPRVAVVVAVVDRVADDVQQHMSPDCDGTPSSITVPRSSIRRRSTWSGSFGQSFTHALPGAGEQNGRALLPRRTALLT